MPVIAVSAVVVDRDRRVRREVRQDAVEILAESISRIGRLIHPIVLDENNVLIAGETRLEAHKHLGLDQIELTRFSDLTEHEALAIELEENIKRTDLPWQDQCDALKKFHELKRLDFPEWGTAETARAIGLSQKHVQDQLLVAQEIESGNVRVRGAKQFSAAKGVTRRVTERRREDELAVIGMVGDAPPPPSSPILNVNFLEWIETYDGPPFNLLHCDFPYGIGADGFNQGAASTKGGYEDSAETYWTLVDTLITQREKLLGSSGHILFWFSLRYYTETLARLREHFWVDPYPLIWHKSNNKGTLPDPTRGPRRVYEVAFLASWGDRKIIQSVSNVFSGPTPVSDHMSEKSQDMLTYFMRMLVDGQTRLLDPTCGSGSALRAATVLGAGSVLGLERDPEFALNATRAWEKYRGQN